MASGTPYIQPSEPADDSREIDLGQRVRHLVSALRRRWWAVLGIFVLVLAMGIWRTMREPHRYRAVSVVRVQAVQAPISGLSLSGPATDFRVDRLVSEQHIIKSKAIAERVVNELGLRLMVATPGVRRSEIFGETIPYVDPVALSGSFRLDFGANDYTLRRDGFPPITAPYGESITAAGMTFAVPGRPEGRSSVALSLEAMRAPAALISGGVGTRVLPQTDIVEISYVATDQILARQVANAVAEQYKEYTAQVMKESAVGKSTFIGVTLDEQGKQLAEAQNALRRFRVTERVSNVTTEEAAHFENVFRTQAAIRTMEAEVDVYEALLERMGTTDTTDAALRSFFAQSPALAANSVINERYSRWMQLRSDRAELLGGRTGGGLVPTEDNPRLQAMNKEIAETKLDLQATASSHLAGLRQRLETARSQERELREAARRFPALAAEEEALLQNAAAMQQLYTNLQEQFQMSRIAESVEASMVRIIDPALTPTLPISPHRKREAIIAAMLGVLFGIAVALLLDKMDNSVKSPDDVRVGLDLAVLGMIPSISAANQAGRKVAAGERLVTQADPQSAVAEAYRSLRTNMAFARSQQGIKTILFTSPGPADGKSTTVANLAITFAQQGQRTLLIDADLRRAVLDKTFEVPRSPGLTDVLIGETRLAEALSATSVPNLSVLGSGQFPANPSELLGSSAMRAVLEEASDLFDIVLLDSPPLLAVTDAAVLATQVDGAVMVVRMGSTAREAARRSLDNLRAVHARVLGAVMNDVRIGGGSYYGGYGYYYYAYYGSEASGNGHRTVAGRLKELVGLR